MTVKKIQFDPRGRVERKFLNFEHEDPYRAYVRIIIQFVNNFVEEQEKKNKEIEDRLDRLFDRESVDFSYCKEKISHLNVSCKNLLEDFDLLNDRFSNSRYMITENSMHRHRQAVRNDEVESNDDRTLMVIGVSIGCVLLFILTIFVLISMGFLNI